MSDDLVVCPSCEHKVPDGRFCKACGKPLHVESEEILKDISEDSMEPPAAPLPDFLREDYDETEDDNVAIPPPEFHFRIDGMGPESMAILFAESEL
ncbi:MAG: hypothetical protein ACFFCP_19345, partial [Promethearchaeota archaeon]